MSTRLEKTPYFTLKDLFIILILSYTFWLTKNNIYDEGFVDGFTIGKPAGIREGYKVGKDEACMIKPI